MWGHVDKSALAGSGRPGDISRPEPGMGTFANLTSGFDHGSGTPVVVVQPLQGRWQWTEPFLLALARRSRVVSYALADAPDFGGYVEQLRDVMDARGLEQAALCGISFGGAVAASFAAQYPERVTRLVIASAPGPGWRPNATQARYVATPWLSMPAFTLGAVGRARREIAAAMDAWLERLGFTLRYASIAIRYPMLPPVVARRVRLLERLDLESECKQIAAPTLVVTGEAALDGIVPVASTRRYAELIPRARYEMMQGTGHLGVLTQPQRFADLVSDFVNANHP